MRSPQDPKHADGLETAGPGRRTVEFVVVGERKLTEDEFLKGVDPELIVDESIADESD